VRSHVSFIVCHGPFLHVTLTHSYHNSPPSSLSLSLFQARPHYILKQRQLGLEDVSATNPRDAHDGLRSGKLQLQSWDLAGCTNVCVRCNSRDVNALQHAATRCSTLQHTATHCNTLQHTATHCYTLQYTATHCDIFAMRTTASGL